MSYADEACPLTVKLVLQVAEHCLQLHCLEARLKMFKNGAPSREWVKGFIRRRP